MVKTTYDPSWGNVVEVDLKEIINSILDIGNTIKEGIVKQSVRYNYLTMPFQILFQKKHQKIIKNEVRRSNEHL